MQVAEQLALRIPAITIGHDTSSFFGFLDGHEKAPAKNGGGGRAKT
jgi:hypothetical protein